jgi:hypothetical protein
VNASRSRATASVGNRDAIGWHIDQQHRLCAVDNAEHRHDVSGTGVGDPAFPARQPESTRHRHGGCAHRGGRQVGAGVGFAGGERADDFAADQPRQKLAADGCGSAVERPTDQQRLRVVERRGDCWCEISQFLKHSRGAKDRILESAAADVGAERDRVQSGVGHLPQDVTREDRRRLFSRIQL